MVVPETAFNSVLRREPPSRCDLTSATTHFGTVRAPSSGHYDTIDDLAVRPQSTGNCAPPQYRDGDALLPQSPLAPPDHPYLNPVIYSVARAPADPDPDPTRRRLPYELIDTNQTDNGHVYVTPANQVPARC